MEQNNVENTAFKKRFDTISLCSLGFGLASIPFSFIGALPLVAIILGAIGITRTKEPHTGRDFAVIGLILGIIFLLNNAYMNGHLSYTAEPPTITQTPDNVILQATTSDSYTKTEKIDTSFQKTEEISQPNESKIVPVTDTVSEVKTWYPITNFSGSGTKNTQIFNITNGVVRVRAAVEPGNPYTSYTSFRLMCTNCGKSYLGPNISINTYGGESKWDTFTYKDLPKGDYYLEINSMVPDTWAVIVEEYR